MTLLFISSNSTHAEGLCTSQYEPVCAWSESGNSERAPGTYTYGNSCEAWKDGAIVRYEWECKTPEGEVCPVASPPYCEGNWHIITGYTQVGNCEIPTFECNKEPIMCTKEYVPVCGQPPMPECSTGMVCAQVMPDIKTYGNSCELNTAGAELLYEWECTTKIEMCPMYSLAIPEPGCYYEYIKDKNDCEIPKLVCEKDEWWEISERLKAKIDTRIESFEQKLNERSSDIDIKKEHVEKIIEKFEIVKWNTNNARLQLLIRYIIFKLEALKDTYSEDSDIDDILDFLE